MLYEVVIGLRGGVGRQTFGPSDRDPKGKTEPPSGGELAEGKPRTHTCPDEFGSVRAFRPLI